MNKNALFGALDAGPTITELNLTDVRPDPEQPRQTFAEEPLKELASSIEQHGQIQPIVVRKDPVDTSKFLITAGERRYRAIELLKRKTVQAIVRDGENAQVIAIIENLQRVDLSPVEEAAAVARLIEEQKLNQKSASKLLGKSRVMINQLLSVNKLPPAIRAEATEVSASKSILIELAQISDKALVTKLWGKARVSNLTVKECRDARKSKSAPKKKATDVGRPTSTEKALGRLHKAVGDVQALKELDDDARHQVREAIDRLNGITVISPTPKGK